MFLKSKAPLPLRIVNFFAFCTAFPRRGFRLVTRSTPPPIRRAARHAGQIKPPASRLCALTLVTRPDRRNFFSQSRLPCTACRIKNTPRDDSPFRGKLRFLSAIAKGSVNAAGRLRPRAKGTPHAPLSQPGRRCLTHGEIGDMMPENRPLPRWAQPPAGRRKETYAQRILPHGAPAWARRHA